MSGWLSHDVGLARVSSGLSSGSDPMMAKRLGQPHTASKAIWVDLGSQLGGWMTAPSTPASSIRSTASRGMNEVICQWAELLGKPVPQVWI